MFGLSECVTLTAIELGRSNLEMPFGGCLGGSCRISIPGQLAYKAGSSIAMTAELEFLLSFA